MRISMEPQNPHLPAVAAGCLSRKTGEVFGSSAAGALQFY
jgi:hypothetical protein